VPGFDRAWRTRVVETWRHAASAVPLRDGGVYWQTFGPRFETPAEIRYIARFADVVGMTVASECVVAGDLGLAYAAVCVVDNLANGVGESELTVEEFEAGKAANRAAVIASLDALVPELA
jgi:5'-methylthioadenosine phosphorylase